MYNECRHIMPSGCKCHSPALTGKLFCYYHTNLQRKCGTAGSSATKLPVPQIEDARGIQMTLQQVLQSLDSPFIHPRAIGHTLYGLQLAIQLLDRAKAPEPANVVRTLCNVEGEPIHQPDQTDQNHKVRKDQMDPHAQTHQIAEASPEVFAPIKTVCEPPHDCLKCIHQETCDNYEEPDEDPTFEEEEEDDQEDEDDAEPDDEDDHQADDEDAPEVDELDEEDGDPDEEDLEDRDNENDGEDPEDAESPEEEQLMNAALRILQKESQPRKRNTSRSPQPPDPVAA